MPPLSQAQGDPAGPVGERGHLSRATLPGMLPPPDRVPPRPPQPSPTEKQKGSTEWVLVGMSPHPARLCPETLQVQRRPSQAGAQLGHELGWGHVLQAGRPFSKQRCERAGRGRQSLRPRGSPEDVGRAARSGRFTVPDPKLPFKQPRKES